MSDTQTLRVAIAAGGTAGHINPALALAEELRDRGHEVCFYGQPTRLEARLVPQAGFEFFPIEVTGFDREKPLSIVPALKNMSQATKKLGRHFADVGAPDVAIGFGAYVEMPLCSRVCCNACCRRRLYGAHGKCNQACCYGKPCSQIGYLCES